MKPEALALIGTGILLLLFLVLWPRKGILARIRHWIHQSRRVLLEDILKYLYNNEYKGLEVDFDGVTGHLGVSPAKTSELLESLHHLGLISGKDNRLRLTDTGRSYALRVIRVHRIWERYLADHTSIEVLQWHDEADRREHQLSLQSADELAAQMGNPVFDPHGDPIPTTQGELPPHKGMPLTKLKEGDHGIILHLEDEPAFIYEQLHALGLYPGMPIYVMDVQDDVIVFAAEGEECKLTPHLAASITVDVRSHARKGNLKRIRLNELTLGSSASVLGISPQCRGQQRRRLLDLGLVPGTRVEAVLRSASGDPTGYRILGAMIGLRSDQAALVYIDEASVDE